MDFGHKRGDVYLAAIDYVGRAYRVLGRIVAMLKTPVGCCYTVREEGAGYSGGQIDSDSDHDPDPEGTSLAE
jgi:hypothetical protein